MSKKHKGRPGYNKQGIPTFDHIKAPSLGRKVEMPQTEHCSHPPSVVKDRDGILVCQCGSRWDFDGKAI